MLRAAFNAYQFFWLRVLPKFFTVANKMLTIASDTCSFGYSFIVICDQIEGIRPARAFRKPEFIYRITILRVGDEILSAVRRLRTCPPLTCFVYAHRSSGLVTLASSDYELKLFTGSNTSWER